MFCGMCLYELSSHVMGKTEKKFSFTNYIHIKSKWGSRNSKLLSFHTPANRTSRILKQSREITSDFHPLFSSTCLLSPKSTPLTGDGPCGRRVLLSSELIQIGSEERLLLIIEIFFKNLDLDMKDRVRKIEGNPDFCCFISTKYCKSRVLLMVVDKARIRNSQYHGLNNAGGSLEHAFIEKLLLWVFYECPKVELDRGFLFASLIQPFVSQFHIYLRMLPPETMVGPFKPQPHLETNISKDKLIYFFYRMLPPETMELSSHAMGKTEKKFSATNYIYIQCWWGSRNSKMLSFHTPGMFYH
uniref:Uncharacterized protein n=1 Tax=Lactuca sativa TaxID=4236 RepID=A0A9R1VYU1_LACSA|nr:hypothetical protein LSAT_V11C400169790 [Lactuca sativa]